MSILSKTDAWRTHKINVVCVRASKFSAKARKLRRKAQKLPAKFDVSYSKLSLLEPELDVNASLQVETGRPHDVRAFDPDLQNRDHVLLFDLLISLRFKLPCIRRILLNLVDDHVKHVFDLSLLRANRVELSLKLPCSEEILSNICPSFPCKSRSRQTSPETSLLKTLKVIYGLVLIACIVLVTFLRAGAGGMLRLMK